MTKRTIALCSALFVAGSSTLIAQNEERGPRQGGRERPDMFALADKDESGGVTLDELVASRVEMMSRRGPRGGGGEGAPQRGQGQRGGDPEQLKAMMKERMAGIFKQADKDENGELSRQEFGQVMQGQRGGRGGGRGQGGPRGTRGGDA